MQHRNGGPRAPHPSLAAVRTSARLSRHLLTATFASLRCRELADQGKVAEAGIELVRLQDALWHLQGAALEAESQREMDVLHKQEEKLRRLLVGGPAAAGRDSTPPPLDAATREL